jgi:hypothetical protein
LDFFIKISYKKELKKSKIPEKIQNSGKIRKFRKKEKLTEKDKNTEFRGISYNLIIKVLFNSLKLTFNKPYFSINISKNSVPWLLQMAIKIFFSLSNFIKSKTP